MTLIQIHSYNSEVITTDFSLSYVVFKADKLFHCLGAQCKHNYIDQRGTSVGGNSLGGRNTSECPRVTLKVDIRKKNHILVTESELPTH